MQYNPAHAYSARTRQTIEPDYLKLILMARVYDVAKESPLSAARLLSARLRNTILIKREDLQSVFSFKCRGAYNRMQHLAPSERAKGVVACSAGNHAQGVALSAREMGMRATIVMPVATPPIKYMNVERLGATVVLHGADFDEAKAECARLSTEQGLVNIPPFDDPYVIAGQGTIGVEILRQTEVRDLFAIFVPIGGGGIAAGIGAYVKRIAPHVRIIGVETYDADSMTQALRCGAPTTLRQVGLFADGTAVRRVGSETYRLCQQYLDETILVNTDETCAAIKDIFEDTRGIVEPSGALATAGCKKYLQMRGLTNKKCVVIASGANMSFERLRFVAERAGLGENREALINVVIPEKPGSFLRLHDIIAPRPVTEFSYRYGDSDRAHIFMSFVVKDRDAELRSIFAQLEQNEMEALDASENEFAKAHARYLVGGRRVVPDERVFRFSFPERPGALNHFLQQLMAPGGWNISLFHYRNYGGDVGKVMAGIQVPPASAGNFNKFLSDLRYPYVEETNNPFYRNFLQ